MENTGKAVRGPDGQAVLQDKDLCPPHPTLSTPGAARETDLSVEEGPGAGQEDDEGD